MSTEEKILKGAAELFFKYGVRSVTMDDIAKNLGMSKKTIYQHYKEKDEIVYKLMLLLMNDNECTIQAIYDKSVNVVEEVFNVMKEMSVQLNKINPLLFYELQKYYPQAWSLIKEFRESFVQKMVETSLEKGKSQGLVRDDINTAILARLRMEEVDMSFRHQSFPAELFSMSEVQAALAEHFLYGVCTLKGHKLINKYKQIVEEEE